MSTIRIHNVINSPLTLVQQALLESLTIHRKIGHIITFEDSDKQRFYSITLHSTIWPKTFVEPVINIQLYTSNAEISTHLYSQISFKYRGGFIPFKKIALKKIVKFEASQILHQFKYRIEKWM